MTTIDERTIAQVMDAMPYGLYIIASTGNTGPNGMMADWVTQLSFRPRLIGIALENDAHTLANVRQSGLFTLNLLEESTEGMDLARRFASPYSASKIGGALAHGVHRKLIEEPHRLTTRGCPVLEAAVAWLECSTRQFVTVGDHTLVIGAVLGGQMQAETPALSSVYTGWSYSG